MLNLFRPLMTAVALALSAVVAPVAQAKVAAPAFDIQGHRGARDMRPENTLAAFRYALEAGATTLELDLFVTQDGHVVVRHDPHLTSRLAKDAQGRWIAAGEEPLIRELTLGQLKTYDVGATNPADIIYWLAHGREQLAVPGERIPTLDEVFELAKGHPHVIFNIETKTDPYRPADTPAPADFARLALERIHAHGLRDRVMLQSFDWRILKEMHRLDPGITLGALTSILHRIPDATGHSPWFAGADRPEFGGNVLQAAASIPADVISPEFREVTPAYVQEAKQLGLRVVPYTVNDADNMKKLIQMGVDGIISDRPALLREVAKQSGRIAGD